MMAPLSIEIVGFKGVLSYNFRVFARNAVGRSEPLVIKESFSSAKSDIKNSLTEVINLALE